MTDDKDKKSVDKLSVAQYYNRYTKFLSNNRAQGAPTHLHMESRKNFKGKFTIDSKDYDTFIEIYKKVLFLKDVHILETQKEVGPLLIDIDFRFKTNSRYNDMTVVSLTEGIFTIVEKYYNFDDSKLEVFILEKRENSKPDENIEEYKDGIHLQMPHIAISSQMRAVIIKDLQKLVDDNQIFDNLDCTDTHRDVDKIIDSTVAYKNAWFMYGSRKPASIPYKLTKIYNKNLEPQSIDYTNEQLVDLLSIRKYEDFDLIDIKQEVRESPEFQEMIDQSDRKHKLSKVVYENNVKIKVNPDEIKLAQELTKILSVTRNDVYEDWIRVGWCLFNIGGYELLDTFRSFSKQNPAKYEAGCCEKVFNEARLGGYTMATLKWWARKDDQKSYHAIIDKYISQYLKSAVSLTDTDVAKYLCEKYKHIVKRTELDWYVFKDGRWNCNRKGNLFSTIVTEELPKDIIDLQIHYQTIAKDLAGDEQDLYIKKSETFNKLIRKIKTRCSKKNIIDEAGDFMTEDNFMNTLDTQLHLIGFNNGVYDLELGLFRESCPDDRITKSVGYDYVEVSKSSKEYIACEKYWSQVFPGEDLRHYALKFFSSLLDGHMRDQKYHMLTGTGANGKSTSVSLIRDTLGDYYIPVPITLFTRKQGNAANASPELMALKGIRAGCMQEPDQGDKMYVGRLKEITGGDQIIGRALFKEMEKFKPQCKIFLTCNNLPDINTVDNGTWRRIRVIPFESEFVVKEDIKYPHQFPRDPELEHSIGKWNHAFMCMLLKYYKIYRKEGLKEPDIVLQHTKEYKRNNDMYQEFIDTNLVVSGKEKDREEVDALYELFKQWFNSSIPGSKCPKKTDFTGYLSKTNNKEFKIKGKYIIGIKYKDNTNSEDEKFD